MNREIKFRAWSEKFGGMIYPESKYEINIDVSGQNIHSVWEDSRDDEAVPVMQYIGLKDKNSKEIYEGDIVKKYEYINGNFIDTITERFEVIYQGVSFQYKPIDGKEYKQYTVSPIGCEVEIIGNIYENTELLNPK